MAKIVWDDTGERRYETGTRRGVLYKKLREATETQSAGDYGKGVGWNGLTGATFTPSGAEETALYADDQKYLSLYSKEEVGATLTAYTYPDEWEECDGSYEIATGVTIGQQPRVGFGFCCRTMIGNDTLGESYGYKLHLLYNAMASPSERAYSTVNDSPEAIEFSWEVKTTPVKDPRLPLPEEVMSIMSGGSGGSTGTTGSTGSTGECGSTGESGQIGG